MYLWVLLLCCVLVGSYILDWYLTRRGRELTKGLPTYSKLPLIGSIHHFLKGTQDIYKRIEEMSQISEDTKKPFVIWVGPKLLMLISDPDDVRKVTNTFIEKPYLYKFARMWLGDGLLTGPGYIWKRNVKKIVTTFTGTVVDGFQEVFNKQALALVEKLKVEAGREPFDIMHKYLAFTTLEAICQTALGFKSDGNIVSPDYYVAFNRALELLIARGVNILYHPDFIYELTPSYREMVKCVRVIRSVSEKVMAERQKQYAENKHTRNSSNCRKDSIEKAMDIKFRPFLDLIMEISEKDHSLTDAQIKAEVDTIILGGQETVASTLHFLLLTIGCKPSVQNNLHEEMRKIFGESRREVTKEDLTRMTYCEAVILETLRLYPPAAVVLRHADHEIDLKSCKVPKGTICGVNAYAANRSPSNWGPDASEFRPERWLESTAAPGAKFLSFSYGKRACIGKRYAIALLKTILAHCIRELEFISEGDKLQLKIDVVIRPVCGHHVRVNLRRR